MDKALLSTGKDDWGTPQKLYDALNKEFGFTLDACADKNNYKCANYYTAEADGLKMDWGGGKPYFATRHTVKRQKATRGRRLGLRNAIKRVRNTAQPLLC